MRHHYFTQELRKDTNATHQTNNHQIQDLLNNTLKKQLRKEENPEEFQTRQTQQTPQQWQQESLQKRQQKHQSQRQQNVTKKNIKKRLKFRNQQPKKQMNVTCQNHEELHIIYDQPMPDDSLKAQQQHGERLPNFSNYMEMQPPIGKNTVYQKLVRNFNTEEYEVFAQ